VDASWRCRRDPEPVLDGDHAHRERHRSRCE
jgi:hypothetical protein